MLCTCPTGRRWRWLATPPCADGDRVPLVEREGACPGDPDGRIVAVSEVPAAQVAVERRAWLQRRTAGLVADSPVDADRPPAVTHTPTDWAPGDQRVDDTHARAAVAAADGAATGFCVFGNPAAHGR